MFLLKPALHLCTNKTPLNNIQVVTYLLAILEKSLLFSVLFNFLTMQGEGGGFESVMQLLNPSSHSDNVDNQLRIALQTQVGFCNSSTTNPQVIIVP